jgi:general secretion pathway protein E
MVGEIRDVETAQIAIQASLTGHLVLSTLHTNTAIGAITRLRDMGVEPFLLASSLIGLMAQRLLRLLCQHCKQAYVPNAVEMAELNLATAPKLYKANGCSNCNSIGYQGRTGIYELVTVDRTLCNMIHDSVGQHELENYVNNQSIYQNGIQCLLAGKTTVNELLRVTKIVST